MICTENLIKKGIIICPKTHKVLHIEGDKLVTDNGKTYDFEENIPFLIDSMKQKEYLSEQDESMKKEYEKVRKGKRAKIKDFASPKALEAIKKIYPEKENDICLSVGGGPKRIHPEALNLNIGNFENVDIVADAYSIPFSNGSVNSVYIGAVLEHIEKPEEVIVEIFRILKSGGKVYSDIPFIQKFHGYPNHFQNYTIAGHRKLFERYGFDILSEGICVGPTYAVLEIMDEYLLILFGSKLIGKIFRKLLFYFGKIIRPLDKKLNYRKNAYTIASTTYVLSQKPL